VHHRPSSLEEVGGELDLAFNGEDSTEDVPDVGSPPANKMREKAKRYQFHNEYANKAQMDDDDEELFKDMYQHDRQATQVGEDHIWRCVSIITRKDLSHKIVLLCVV
jgi:hypothetical protein